MHIYSRDTAYIYSLYTDLHYDRYVHYIFDFTLFLTNNSNNADNIYKICIEILIKKYKWCLEII